MEPLFWPSPTGQPVRNLRRRLSQGQVFWREAGNGPAVVFLHGSWDDSGQWSDLIETFSQGYHCIAPDLLGCGESERLAERSAYSVDLQVQTLDELLGTLRLRGPVTLVGDTLGAWVAARYALAHPEQVAALAVIDPEGVTQQPWGQERWLLNPLAGLWLSLSKLWSGRSTAWLRAWHRRQQLRRHEGACRMLFQRRRSQLEAELLGTEAADLTVPTVALQVTGDSRAAAFAQAAGASLQLLAEQPDTAIKEFLQEWLLAQRPQTVA